MATHPPTWLALAGLAVVSVRPRSRTTWAVAGLAGFPWLRHRLVVAPRPGRRREQLAVLPLAFLVDATEALTVAASGLRHRTFLL